MTTNFDEIDDEIDQLAQDGELAPGTRKAHEDRWKVFERWCRAKGLSTLPAEPTTVAAFYVALAEGTASKLGKPCARSYLKSMRYTISRAHHDAGLPSPTVEESVKSTYRGAAKQLRGAQAAPPVMPEDMRKIQQAHAPRDIGRLQDFVLMVISAYSGLRIVELQDLRVGDVGPHLAAADVRDAAHVGAVVVYRAGDPLFAVRCTCDEDRVCLAHEFTKLREEAALHSPWLFPFYGTREGLRVRGASDPAPRGGARYGRVHSMVKGHPEVQISGGAVTWLTNDEHEQDMLMSRLSPDHYGPRFRRIRDQVMTLVAWHASLRCSEFTQLRASDLKRTQDGYLLPIRRSKTDQHGAGALASLKMAKDPLLCPVRALDRWLALVEVTGEDFLFPAIFRSRAVTDHALGSPAAVNFQLRQLAADTGLDGLTSHSFRNGFAKSAKAQGASVEDVMTKTRHRAHSVAAGYMTEDSLAAETLRGMAA